MDGVSGGVHNGNTSALFSSSGVKGITSQSPGSVMLGAQDLTARTWTHIAGSTGEAKAVYAEVRHLRHCFGTILHAFLSAVPPRTRRVTCSN